MVRSGRTRIAAAGKKAALQRAFDHAAQVLAAHHPHRSAAALGGVAGAQPIAAIRRLRGGGSSDLKR
jgi:hypothetical protein